MSFKNSSTYSPLLNRQWLRRIAASVLILFAFSLALNGQQFAGGSGSAADPYLIANVEHFQNIRSAPNSAHFRLINNIDASATAGWNNGQGFNPTGWWGGVLDGDGYTVTGLTINRPGNTNTGVISRTGSDAEVKNIHFENVVIVGGQRTGTITGILAGTITGVTITGSVSGAGITGGVAGQVDGGGSVLESNTEINVTGAGNHVGGITGILNSNATLTNVSNTGNVSGQERVGGVAGQVNSNATINNAVVIGNVTGSGSYSGGITGLLNSNATLTHVSLTGNVSGQERVGGVAGQVNSNAVISDATANGNVEGSGNLVGGIAGYSQHHIINSSFSGNVSGTNDVGGAVGKNEGSLSFVMVDASIIASGDNTGGLVGYNNSGIIENCSASGSLSGNDQAGGLVGHHAYVGGVITGCSSSMNVTGDEDVGGLVGYNQDGLIELSYSTGSVTGSTNVGGLVGLSQWGGGLIRLCFSESDVTAVGGNRNQIGGLVGQLNQGTVENSYARGSVSGSNRVGGLIGYVDQSGKVYNSFSTGAVNGSAGQSGGLIGGRHPHGTVGSSFWDTQTSGMNSSSGGLGRTTAQMLDSTMFQNAGWDFDNIWSMDPSFNDGYPFLLPLSGAFQLVWTGQIDSVWEKTGNWNLNRLPDSDDNVRIPGVPNQPLLSSHATVNHLTIQPNASLSINHNGALTVLQSLNNNAGNSGLVILSDSLGTGSLIHQSNLVPATFQRYIPGLPEAWHTLSSPMTAQNFSPEFTPAGTYGDGTGYDLYHWHEPDTSWIYYNHPAAWNATHGDLQFIPGNGYLVAYQDTNPTFSFQGFLNNGNITIPLTRSTGASDEFGYNLTGNPYPSSIDWKATSGWDRSTLEESAGGYNIYIWNDEANNYGVYNSASTGDQGTLGTSRYIAPTQGFFVIAEQSGNLTFSHDTRVHNGSGNWLRGAKESDHAILLSVNAHNNLGSDQVMIEFGHEATQGGAIKKFSFIPSAPSLYMPVNGKNWAMKLLNDTVQHPVIPVALQATVEGVYTLNIQFDKALFPTLYLEDLKTGLSYNLHLTTTLSVQAKPSDDPNRFVLRFTEGGWPNPFLPLPAHFYTANKNLHSDLRLLDPETTYQLSVLDLSGREVFRLSMPGGNTGTIPMPHLNGIFVVRLTGPEGAWSGKLFW